MKMFFNEICKNKVIYYNPDSNIPLKKNLTQT